MVNILSYKIEELDFSVRIINCLKSKKIYYVSDLVKCRQSQLLKIPNFGKKCLLEVIIELKTQNLTLSRSPNNFSSNHDGKKFELKSERFHKTFYKDFEKTISSNSLEEELQKVVSYIKGERNQQIVMKYLGWDGKGKKTLESVAQGYGLTRERVRQIYAKFEKKVLILKVVKNAEYLKLESALKYINDYLPSETDQIELGLIREGITKTNFNIEGIESASRLLGKTIDFTILKMKGKHIAISQKDVEIPKIVINLIKKNIAKSGVANIVDITNQVNEKINRNFPESFITSVASAHEDFKWLDKLSDWFWFQSLPRNRLLNVIRKILSVTYSIEFQNFEQVSVDFID